MGDVPLNVNFALSIPVPLLGTAAVLSRIVTNALFLSQLLQWNIKLLIMFISQTNWGVLMHYMMWIKGLNNGIAQYAFRARKQATQWAAALPLDF